MKKHVLITLLYCCFICTAYGQLRTYSGAITLKGVVMDSTTKAVIGNVTVEAMELKSNQFIQRVITKDDGSFVIGALPRKPLQLIFSCTGYNSTTLQITSYSSPIISLEQIALSSLAGVMKEVEVAAIKPIIEHDIDKLIYNVDADPESRIASAFDILLKVPLLTTDAEDRIQLNGATNYRILINGRSSSLFALDHSGMLKNMSASAIKAIEIITMPSSRYEAEGIGGIINIITYKKTISGYNGGLNLRGGSPGALAVGNSLSASVGKVTLGGTGSYNSNEMPANNSYYLRNDKIQHTKLEQSGTGYTSSSSHTGSGEISYAINNLNLFRIGYADNRSRNNNQLTEGATLFDSTGIPLEAYSRHYKGSSNQLGKDVDIGYQRDFRKKEIQQLTMSYKWTQSKNSSGTDFMLQPLIRYHENQSTTANDDSFGEHAFKVDYVQPVRDHTIEAGAGYIRRQNSSDYFYSNVDTASGMFIVDQSQSNSFYYNEKIYSAYATINLWMGKWSIKGGARIEKEFVDAHFISNDTIAQSNYCNIIPTLALSKHLKGSSTISASYTQRIQRPDLNDLNPYTDRTDPWNISYGNPLLQPALTNVFNLAYNTLIKKTSLSITVCHRFSNNAIQQFTILEADTITRTTYGNIGKTKSYNFSLNGSTTLFQRLSLNLNHTIYYTQYTSTIKGRTQMHEGLTYTISSAAALRLNHWRFSSNVSYSSPNILVQGKTASYLSNSFSLSRFLFKNNKATLGLNVTSPFREYRRSFTEISDPSFYQLRQSNTVLRRYSLSFNYRFQKVRT